MAALLAIDQCLGVVVGRAACAGLLAILAASLLHTVGRNEQADAPSHGPSLGFFC